MRISYFVGTCQFKIMSHEIIIAEQSPSLSLLPRFENRSGAHQRQTSNIYAEAILFILCFLLMGSFIIANLHLPVLAVTDKSQ